jgi:cell wall-associated NlpC family hydrolase
VTHSRSLLLVGGLLLILLPLLLACTASQIATQTYQDESPRWACPSPTPLPYGPDGPIKDVARRPRPTTAPVSPVEYDETAISYEEWEQEYPDLPGPPFPSPTPYAIVSSNFVFGQRVRVSSMFATVSASFLRSVDDQGLYAIQITWLNPMTTALPIDYGQQVLLQKVRQDGDRVLSDDSWRVSEASLRESGFEPPPSAIPPGESTTVIPVLAPIGEPHTVELRFVRSSQVAPTPATAGTPVLAVASPTSTPAGNPDLRAPRTDFQTVQWVNAPLGVGPGCDDPGAVTDWWIEGEQAWGVPDAPVEAPSGAPRVVQLALSQVGGRYVWGASSPEQGFDCSGLVSWSYRQIGISIPRVAADQYALLRPVQLSQSQPGDLVTFHERGATKITHVGMLVGDQDGDGTWDLVHAMSPRYGIQVTYNIFGSSYYGDPATCQLCIAGVRTARWSLP